MAAPSKTCDIFCTIVDNYGDIGVCWRLARQLAAEHGYAVRLWADNLASFRQICPDIDAQLFAQNVRGVEVRHWREPFPPVAPADVVVEGFGCKLPEVFLEAMVARRPQPVWINLEYLSAEDWVEGSHGLPSVHPRLPLTKYFFFPGFTEKTGGLPIEHGFAARRDAFQGDAAAIAQFWREVGLASPAAGELRVSLFAYENPALPALMNAWAGGDQAVLCVVPEGRTASGLLALAGKPLAAGGNWRKGQLEVRVIPFLEQDRYDRLLWACDINFVRGEDSFVRAQLAARPLVWHIYPQDERAHLKKLEAFLDLYCRGLPAQTSGELRAFWETWNGAGSADVAATWRSLFRQRELLQAHARGWAAGLGAMRNLTENLAFFCQARLK